MARGGVAEPPSKLNPKTPPDINLLRAKNGLDNGVHHNALAILALDRNSGHLAEQTALKSVVPVVALAADKTLASTNMSWMFRLQPDTTPATALRMLVAAECRSGANPERLRKVLASAEGISGVSLVTTGEPPKQ